MHRDVARARAHAFVCGRVRTNFCFSFKTRDFRIALVEAAGDSQPRLPQ